MNANALIEQVKLRIWYEWTKFDLRYLSGRVAHFRSDGSYRFYCFILLPDRYQGDYHRVMWQFETCLVWRIGGWFFLIADWG